MGRVYTVAFKAVAATEDQDLFELTPADDHPIKVLKLILGQTSEVGDAQEEMMGFEIIRGYTTSGSGGSSATPVPIDPGDAAATFAAEINNTTIAADGTTKSLHCDSFNVRSGLQFIWTPETQLMASQANTTIAVRLLANPADSVTMCGTVYVEEM